MNRTRIRDSTARAAYRLAVKHGVQLDFIDVTGSAVAVWGFIQGNEQNTGLRSGGSTDENSYTFIVPRQTSFPPAIFKTGATVRYPTSTGIIYEIEKVVPDNEDVLQASTFRLECGRFGETAETD